MSVERAANIRQEGGLEPEILDTLKMDDYLLADFVRGGSAGYAVSAAEAANVNFYVAYYASQRGGVSAHSPRTCLPGGGWDILVFREHQIAGAGQDGTALRVNRAIVQHGSERQLVYYWFQERGRNVTNEYLVKWYLFEDALVRNRTDGALVRLTTPLGRHEAEAAGDLRLEQFARGVHPILAAYLPD